MVLICYIIAGYKQGHLLQRNIKIRTNGARNAMKTLVFLASLLSAPLALAADPVRIVADIGPVASLAQAVAGANAEVVTILPAGASPHDFALRPSQARAVSEADLVIWIGVALTPALGRSVDALAPDVARLSLLDIAGTTLLDYRALDAFAEAQDDHDHDHDHGHGATDPHAWLMPGNARVWLGGIAEALAAQDPANAEAYRANAAEAAAGLVALEARLARMLAPVKGKPLVVDHDALHYFEDAFGLTVIGAITDSDDAAPSPRALAGLRDRIADAAPACLLAAPGTDPDLVAAVSEDSALPVAIVDPLGAGLEDGPALYPATLEAMAEAIAACGP